jgi:uncharacterized integral membrane protein
MVDNNTSNGIGVGTTLFIVFLVLKLTNTIDWSWWWVTSPLWLPLALGIVILGVVGMLIGASGKFRK